MTWRGLKSLTFSSEAGMASVYDIELDQGSDAVIPFEMYDANDTPLDLLMA